jgi:hypothetical protein
LPLAYGRAISARKVATEGLIEVNCIIASRPAGAAPFGCNRGGAAVRGARSGSVLR